MNLRRTLLLAALSIASAAQVNQAHAQNGAACGGYGYGYWDIGRLYSVLADNVPYYAAFPPVYYSYPVPRTYGYSPFAYPPGVMTPEVESVEPLSINNPYYSGEAEEATVEAKPAPADKTTSTSRQATPLVISNPFVSTASVKLAAAR